MPIRLNRVVSTMRVFDGWDHINGIEEYWSYATHWLYPYRGVPRHRFHLYLKEAGIVNL